MNKFVVLSCLLFSSISFSLTPQSRTQSRKQFIEAESWILFEDYKEAMPLYLQLLKAWPQNSNFKYRIGQCYLNIPGEKDKAVNFLEDAAKNIDSEYKQGRFRETGAPFDALFYLGNAYMINYQLDKAIETFNLFRENVDAKVYDTSIIAFQIKSCNNAKELMRDKAFVREKNLGNPINDNFSEYAPVVSDDETMMVFSKSLRFYDALLYSTRVNGLWTNPVNMNELLKVDRDLYPSCFSKDGKTLYLYSSEGYDGSIFKSQFKNNLWSPPVALNDKINTKFWESHAAVSHDDKKLYFTSNRKGGFGELDIYVAERDSSGDWGNPVNLGPVINTKYNENTPFLSEDDKTLFFSSRGHFTMGGYDIFYSTLLENGEWSDPVNAGYPLNSTDDDLFYKPLYDGFAGYFAKYSADGLGGQDIYHTEIFSDLHPRKFLIHGTAKVEAGQGNTGEQVKITAARTNKPGIEIISFTDPLTGDYEFVAPHGDYKITYEANNSEKLTKNFDFPLKYPSDSILLPGTALHQLQNIAELSTETTVTKDADIKRSVVTGQKPAGVSADTAGRRRKIKTGPQETADMQKGITSGNEPVTPVLKDKNLSSGEKTENGNISSQSVNKTDQAVKKEVGTDKCWILWFLIGLGIILLIIFDRRKRRKKIVRPEN